MNADVEIEKEMGIETAAGGPEQKRGQADKPG